ncbi:MAG TPA: hypothetical protein VGS96_06735 [Thermoanaerobaculia bacterium]|jgi:hypothetical protein|nr:hypothetical protein [Thermoanaerobaculia bacterium]
MSDPVLALLLVISLFIAIAVVRFFKTLDGDFWHAAATPIFAGIAAGVLIRLLDLGASLRPVVIGIVVTIAALYSRLTGEESEPADGMLLGAASGAAASLPLVINTDWELQAFATCVIAGAVAGYGIVFAAFHVADKLRQLFLDIVTAAIAAGAAHIPLALSRAGIDERRTAIAVAALVPLLGVVTVFKQWPDIRAELRHEASLGFIDDADVRPTAHPFLRLGRGGWNDSSAHREFVRLANRIALRKRQQRNRSDEMARLYQLEIIKLRMQLQEMARIDHATAETRSPSAAPTP